MLIHYIKVGISMKRKFKDLVKVIKDKDCVVEEKVKYIERILDSTPELVNVKGPRHLLHYAVNTDYAQDANR